ncbi:MAG: sugar phosphate nucleotidyltransferase, partial [archaeon]
MAITKALILAAGDGKRMQPLSDTRNKSLMPVANKPILLRSLDALKEAGISEVCVIINPESEVKAFLGTEQNQLSLFFVEQSEPLGTAHAISMAKDKLTDDFLVLNGDDLCAPEHLKNVITSHKSKATVSVIKKENPQGLGIVEVENNIVTSIIEKPANSEGVHFVNIGIYAFSPEIFKIIETLERSPRGEYEITDAIQKIIKNNEPVSAVAADSWLPINYPWDLLAATKKFIDATP